MGAGLDRVEATECNVKYTADFGQAWNTQLLPYLGVRVSSSDVFLFRGAPDDVICKNTSVTIGGQSVSSGSQDDSSEEELVDNSFQRNPIHGIHGYGKATIRGKLVSHPPPPILPPLLVPSSPCSLLPISLLPISRPHEILHPHATHHYNIISYCACAHLEP